MSEYENFIKRFTQKYYAGEIGFPFTQTNYVRYTNRLTVWATRRDNHRVKNYLTKEIQSGCLSSKKLHRRVKHSLFGAAHLGDQRDHFIIAEERIYSYPGYVIITYGWISSTSNTSGATGYITAGARSP